MGIFTVGLSCYTFWIANKIEKVSVSIITDDESLGYVVK